MGRRRRNCTGFSSAAYFRPDNTNSIDWMFDLGKLDFIDVDLTA
ncbi:hypothetical protein [Streptomyces sp. MMBL 11-1]|nr:hypothetical protein [Streptomyces sp. MMBL 11-1]